MEDSDKLEDCKKEIRSILIPFQKGIFLSQFHGEYKNFIGKSLPVREFGFKSDTEFLYSMPDVVKMTPTRTGDYHLLGIADEKSKHIQKMVARQKPAKLKLPPSRTAYNLPPRFSCSKRVPEPYFPPRTSHKNSAIPSKEASRINKDPVLTLKETSRINKDPVLTLKETSRIHEDSVLPHKETLRNSVQSNTELTLQEEIISLVKASNNKLALNDFRSEYKKKYGKQFSLSLYDISSLEECIELISELDIVKRNKVDFIVYCSELPQISDNEIKNSYISSGNSASRTPTPEMASNFNSIQKQSCYSGNVPETLKQKLQKVAELYPGEILASDFPGYFECANAETLNLQNLGYRGLSDLIDDVPDIFSRKSVAGSRKDYIIFSAKSEVDNSYLFVDHIVSNFRKLLETCPEGIKIKDIVQVYNINYKDSLHIEDLGFDDLEVFLSSIKNSVPLIIKFTGGHKTVHLNSDYSSFDFYTQSKTNNNKTFLPSDADNPNFKYKPLVLPSDFNYAEFKPVYVSAVAHPGHLYIQFQDENIIQNFVEMSKKLEAFYEGKQSELYLMKDIHIKSGVSCVAKWPADQHWYRAQVLSDPLVGKVKVGYVDYGTSDSIPTNLLRYVKKEYIDLPAQAVKCRLSYIRPAKNAQKWDTRARSRVLSLCCDTPLMAKLEKRPDGIYSIVLCDTNGLDDVYINDVLQQEGLAEYDVEEEPIKNDPVPIPPAPKMQLEYHHDLHPLQALTAQFYLKAFATAAPSFAQNENYLALLTQISMYCQTPDTLQPNKGTSFTTSSGPPGLDSLPRNMNLCASLSTMYDTCPTDTTAFGSLVKPAANIPPPSPIVITADQFIKAPVEPEPIARIEEDNDIFEDIDDEMFQQLCQEVSSSKLRYVKRVHLGDGYKLHIILVDSTPYASSGDISHLIWNNQEADYMYRRLQQKDTDIPYISLSEDGNEELFQQLNRFDVKGVKTTTGFKCSILLYELKNVLKILNIFGHPSVTLRTKLKEEIAAFNPEDRYWKEFSVDATETDEENSFTGTTDDDKIERLCLYDLITMKESILCKMKKMMRLTDLDSYTSEFQKLNQLLKKVLERIREIKEICKEFE